MWHDDECRRGEIRWLIRAAEEKGRGAVFGRSDVLILEIFLERVINARGDVEDEAIIVAARSIGVVVAMVDPSWSNNAEEAIFSQDFVKITKYQQK